MAILFFFFLDTQTHTHTHARSRLMQCIWKADEIIYSIPSICIDVYCAHPNHITIYQARNISVGRSKRRYLDV